MKKIVFIALTHVFLFIGNAQNLTFQAEIANRKGDTIKILNSSNGKEVKKMGIDKKGLFKDAFAVEEGIYFLFDGKDYATQRFFGFNRLSKGDSNPSKTN